MARHGRDSGEEKSEVFFCVFFSPSFSKKKKKSYLRFFTLGTWHPLFPPAPAASPKPSFFCWERPGRAVGTSLQPAGPRPISPDQPLLPHSASKALGGRFPLLQTGTGVPASPASLLAAGTNRRDRALQCRGAGLQEDGAQAGPERCHLVPRWLRPRLPPALLGCVGQSPTPLCSFAPWLTTTWSQLWVANH